MDDKDIKQWELALDAAELNPLTSNLPKDSPPGELYVDDSTDPRRKWLRVRVISGNVGARWAYWSGASGQAKKILPNERFEVVADKIFNNRAYHFAGMLDVPYIKDAVEVMRWVLVEPQVTGPIVVRVVEEPVKTRYERSKEIYNVETGETEDLP